MANVISQVIESSRQSASLADQILRERNPIFALIGAGLSCAANGPTWERLLEAMGEQLAARAKSQVREDVDQLEQFQRLRRDHNPKQAGEIWKWSRIHYEEKQRLLNGLFGNLQPGTIHRDLVSCGFRGILTLNYDHLLEDAYAQITGRSITPFLPNDLARQDFFFGDDFFIAKLHGDMARWESIVVGDTDYTGATWPKKANPLVSGHTVLVLGISLQDSIINDFLFGLPANTRVHVVMPASEVSSYRQWLLSLRSAGMPNHISLHSLEHSELPVLVHDLKPPVSADTHIDCSWSDLPPSGGMAVDFGQPTGQLRTFLHSNKRLAHVESQPGWGLSSFLSQVLADRARAGVALVVRMEAKEWLCWDKYVLQLLANVNGLLEKYTELRAAIAPAATASPEPHTIAQALQALGRPVVICIEQSHRLRTDAIDALQMIIDESHDQIKFILGSSHALPTTLQADTFISLTRPPQATLTALAARQHISLESLARVLDINHLADLNTLVLAGALIEKEASHIDLDSHIRNADLCGLCSIAIQHIRSSSDEDELLLRLLKACVIFQSPRTPQALKACFSNCTTTVAAERLQSLTRYGFLIESEDSNCFTMSTSVLSALKGVLSWDDNEFQELSKLVGTYQEDVSFSEIENLRFDRKAIYKAIPGVAEAIEHYKQSGDRTAYLNAVDRISRPLIQMCHHYLIGIWLDECPTVSGLGAADARTDWMLAALRIRIAISRSATGEQRAQLIHAETALQRLAELGEDIATERAELEYYSGIVAESHREHESAKGHFNSVVKSGHASARRVFDARLRLAQSLLSLGKLSTTEKLLEAIKKDLANGECQLSEADRLHCDALIASRSSTLATMRLQLFERKPKEHIATKEILLSEALRHAEEVRRSSDKLERTDVRRGRPDKIGVGIGHFQRAEAYLAGRNFDEAYSAAKTAAGILGAYVNSSWWLILCHETAARSLALRGDAESAKRELSFARHLWNDSRHDDPIRDCEFEFTEGLIAFKQDCWREAVDNFEQSLKFNVHSPCIEAIHLDYFLQALARDQQTRRTKEATDRYFSVPIEW